MYKTINIAMGETFQINRKLYCDDNCFKYLVKCKVM